MVNLLNFQVEDVMALRTLHLTEAYCACQAWLNWYRSFKFGVDPINVILQSMLERMSTDACGHI